MRFSDRGMALVSLILAFLIPLAFLGFIQFFLDLSVIPPVMWVLYLGGFGLMSFFTSIYLYFRNYPVLGKNEDDVRRNIRSWYQDAKKWMDEHPEHVEMKDL